MSLQVLQRRAAGARSSRRRLLLVAGSAVVLVVTAVWALFFSSWFTVTAVRVEGVTVLSAGDVLRVAAVRDGIPLIRFDGDGAEERVGALPPVEEVSVSRRWPHTVVITVVERQPALAVPSAAGFSIYDGAGVAYTEVVAAPAGVPQLNSGGSDPVESALVEDVLSVLDALPGPLLDRLVTVRAETADSIELDLADGVVVVWGSADQTPRKVEVLTALMQRPGRVYIVSAPEVPAIRE